MDNKKRIVNLESFRDMLHISLRVHGQTFAEPPFEEEIIAFICFLGHSAAIRMFTDVNINKLYQPWRSFAAIINKCLTEKSSGNDSLRLSQAQILTIDTTIDQQTAMDVALVPHAKRLRIGRRNFRLLSDIKSKESTLQLVYDVLRLCPFFKAFLVTADQSSSVSSQFVTSMLNPTLDVGMESIFETTSQMDVQTLTFVAPLPISAPTMTPSTIATITTTSQALILPTIALRFLIQNLPNFGSLFGFDNRLRTLEANFSEAMQTKQFARAVSAIPGIRRRDDDTDKDKEPSDGPDRGSKRCREGKEPGSASAPTGACADHLSDGRALTSRKPPTPDRDWNKTVPATHRSIQSWISELTKRSDSRSSFNELMDTLLDFSNFLINRLKVDTLTPKLLASPTYELMKGLCKSLVELEYHLEEVFKAKTDQLDWNNPKGQQYPHNLLKPLPLIPNNRGRRVIPFEHFINNDLECLCGGTSSRKYTTSITKTKAAYYGHIKWIEDLVPRTMWIEEPLGYDKHALWGVSHWGRKRQQFYGFVVNRESARDVYSKRKIIVVTELKIVEWHNYKHLDWITVRRDDDKLYKFKKGDFKRLRIQDIKDMLLLLVQGKLTNLIVEERFAFNVSLRMFTRSIVIQRRMEDLQLGVESYQKKLNLTKLDSYRSDLKCKEAYTAYFNPRGFIYQNKDKKNRLMRIDELHKFSDGMLTDVRTALDDRLKAIDKRLKTRRIMRSLERLLEECFTRETSGCYKGPYDLSYATLIFQKVVRYRYSNPMIQPEPEGSTQRYPLVSVEVLRTMDTTVDQQVAMDEVLVPHAQRLRIGRSNFRLLSDIKSKESTLQLVYDVMRICPFFKAFLLTMDVPEIYMQEFWATATVHHHAI
nr:hypothetical protein [Tanacetum cinerariifolium]